MSAGCRDNCSCYDIIDFVFCGHYLKDDFVFRGPYIKTILYNQLRACCNRRSWSWGDSSPKSSMASPTESMTHDQLSPKDFRIIMIL